MRPSTPGPSLRPALISVTRRTLTSAFAAGPEHQLLPKLRTFFRSPALLAVKIRCRSRRTSSSAWRPVHGVPSPRHRPQVRFAMTAVQLAHRFPVSPFTWSPQAHLTHVSSLSGRATRPYPASYPGATGGGARHAVPRFSCRLFGHRHSLLGSSCARCGTQPSSRSAFRRASPPDPNGVVVLHMSKDATGQGAPLTPGTAVRSPAGDYPPAGTRRFPAASPYGPAGTSHRRGSPSRGRHQGFTHVRPSPRSGWMPPQSRGSTAASRRSSPRLRPPDGTRTASASTPGLRTPAVTRDARRGGDGPSRTGPGTAPTAISRTSGSASHLNSCTLTSHIADGSQRQQDPPYQEPQVPDPDVPAQRRPVHAFPTGG